MAMEIHAAAMSMPWWYREARREIIMGVPWDLPWDLPTRHTC